MSNVTELMHNINPAHQIYHHRLTEHQNLTNFHQIYFKYFNYIANTLIYETNPYLFM